MIKLNLVAIEKYILLYFKGSSVYICWYENGMVERVC